MNDKVNDVTLMDIFPLVHNAYNVFKEYIFYTTVCSKYSKKVNDDGEISKELYNNLKILNELLNVYFNSSDANIDGYDISSILSLSNNDYAEGVVNILHANDILLMIAEECNELAQACLKYTRACGYNNNVTPITKDNALSNLYEETIDLFMCLRVLLGDELFIKLLDMSVTSDKWKRWYKRLQSKNGNCGGNNNE